MEEKIFKKQITAPDGTTEVVETTPAQMTTYLIEHGKAKMVCTDAQELFDRYIHVYEREFVKAHPKPKGKRGGIREGAGRKAKEGGTFRHGFRFSKKVHDIIEEHADDRAGFVERAIIFYARRDGD